MEVEPGEQWSMEANEAKKLSFQDGSEDIKLVFQFHEENMKRLSQELTLLPQEFNGLKQDIKQAVNKFQNAQELFKKFRTKEQRREIVRYIHDNCNPNGLSTNPTELAAARGWLVCF